jgi:hypothetical protein
MSPNENVTGRSLGDPVWRHSGTLAQPNAVKLGRVTDARYMSTHAIKTELHELLGSLAPEKTWSKRVTVKTLAEFALDSFDRSSTQRDVQRALELADAVTPRLG